MGGGGRLGGGGGVVETPPDSPRVEIVESLGEDKSYKYSFTYEKATLYEFKFTRAPHPDSVDPCFR
jgi:hypothetical protein